MRWSDRLRRLKMETVLPDHQADQAVAAIIKAAKTGKIGDGKIFVYAINEAHRIRTGERDENAV